MAGVRKLFINEDGLATYARAVIYQTENTENAYENIDVCKEKLLEQFKLAVKIPKVKSISVTEDGYIRVRTNDLFISNNETGVLRKWYVGKWEVEISKYGDYHFKSYNKQDLGFYSNIWGDNTVHPHISGRDGHACLGNASAGLQYYLSIGAVKALVIYLLGYLESVNLQDSAGVYLGACKEVEIDKFGNPAVDTDGNYIYIDNEFTRNDASRVSSYSGDIIDREYKEYITNMSGKCEVCGKYHNADHLIRMNDGNYVCNSCKEKMKRCDICGEYATHLKHDDNLDIDCCDKCSSIVMKSCEMCDDVYVPNIVPDLKAKLQELNSKSFGETAEERATIINNIVMGSNTEEYLKNTTAIIKYKDAKENVYYKEKTLCENCKGVVSSKNFKRDNLQCFTKYNTTENMVDILKEIPYKTYKMGCTNCGGVHYVEDMVMDARSVRMYPICVNCASYIMRNNYRMIPSPTSLLTYAAVDYLINTYVSVKISNENSKCLIKFESANGDIGNHEYSKPIILIPKKIIKDDSIKNLEYEKTIVKEYDYDNTESILSIPQVCPVCSKDVADDDDLLQDKKGNKIHRKCAEETFVRCSSCNKMVSVADLAINSTPEMVDKLKEIDIAYDICGDCMLQQEICPCCNTIIDPNDCDYYRSNDETLYHLDCAEEYDICRWCSECETYVDADNTTWCEEREEYICEDCIEALSDCAHCNRADCPYHPANED